MAPKLSILIPSLHARRVELAALLGELSRQIGDSEVSSEPASPVEVLVSIDGGATSVGDKRNRLLHAATGDYIAFVDDDDLVAEKYVERLLAAITEGETRESQRIFKSAIITFNVEYVDISQRSRTLYVQSLQYTSGAYEIGPQKVGTPPTHIACWRRNIALANSFPPISYAEDWLWWQPLLQSGLVASEIHVDEVLYTYQFDRRVTETQKRQKREEALKWAGSDGVHFFWGDGRICSTRNVPPPGPETGLDFICTCTIT